MEISRHFTPSPITPSETASARPVDVRPASQPVARQADGLPLEQLHESLRAMPEVDMDRISLIKQALRLGEISTDPAELASGMLTYHRGNDA